MRLPDMGRTQAAPPGEHDMVFIQHIPHELPDANGVRMLPNGSQQNRARPLALKLVRHGEGNFRRVCLLAHAPEGATTHSGNIVVVFDHNDPTRMLPLIFRTEPVDKGRIGPTEACPKSEVRGFRRKPPVGLNDPLPIIRKQWAQDHGELVAKLQSIMVQQNREV